MTFFSSRVSAVKNRLPLREIEAAMEKISDYPLVMRATVLLIAVAYPYLCGLGGFPNIDEGVYAYSSIVYNYNLLHNQPLAPLQGFAFWPWLLAWIPDLPGVALIWFRIADMLAALISGWLLCAIMQRECGVFSNAIGLVFLLCMTSRLVIDNGFKNSFFPAYACLFGAVLILSGVKPSNFRWFFGGVLTGFGILLRETFFPFALLGLIVAWRKGGIKKAAIYSLGGVAIVALIGICVELSAPGSLASLYKGYVDRALVYKAQTNRIYENFIFYSSGSLTLFRPALTLFAAIALWFVIFWPGWTPGEKASSIEDADQMAARSLPWGKLSFWLCVALAPLYETLVKISFYYHFSVALPGMACLAAVLAGRDRAFGGFRQGWKKNKIIVIILIAWGCAGAARALDNLPDPGELERTVSVLARFPKLDWPESLIPESNVLRTIQLAKSQTPDGGFISANGAMFFLYPASGLSPNLGGAFDADDNYRLGDLGRFYLQTGKNGERLKKALLANPPDVIILARPLGGHEPSFSDELADVLIASGRYKKFASVDPRDAGNKATDNAWLAYDLYRRDQRERVEP